METPAATQEVLELVPLGKLHLRLAPAIILENTPIGTLMIIELTGFEWESDRVNASMIGKAAADWLTAGPNGVATFDVRVTLQTNTNYAESPTQVGEVHSLGQMPSRLSVGLVLG